jgi:hypothetical protein
VKLKRQLFYKEKYQVRCAHNSLKITNPKHILELTAGWGTGSHLSLSVASN